MCNLYEQIHRQCAVKGTTVSAVALVLGFSKACFQTLISGVQLNHSFYSVSRSFCADFEDTSLFLLCRKKAVALAIVPEGSLRLAATLRSKVYKHALRNLRNAANKQFSGIDSFIENIISQK